MKNIELCKRDSIKCKEAGLILRNKSISMKSQRCKVDSSNKNQLKKLNRVVCGDAYKNLRKLPGNSIDVCYLDPPFFARRVFEIETKDGQFNYFDDRWENNITKYLEYMVMVLEECHRVLKKSGSLFIHCDWHASHYLKVELDKIFGYHNFHNEIIWRRHNSHNDGRQGCKVFGRVHDVILFYSKSKNYIWNPIFQPYTKEYIDKYYKFVEPDTGRRYAKGDLSGPGHRSKGNAKYQFLDVTRYWRYSKNNMHRLYKNGRIIQTKKGNVPLMKRYLDEMPGIPLQDVWDDIKSVQLTKRESVDYPTQKPVRLLERIIEVSSNEKAIILDPMCGCGTALEAAFNLNRNYIGFDISSNACALARNRIRARKVSVKNKKRKINDASPYLNLAKNFT